MNPEAIQKQVSTDKAMRVVECEATFRAWQSSHSSRLLIGRFPLEFSPEADRFTVWRYDAEALIYGGKHLVKTRQDYQFDEGF
jgi:hypothetical protein